MVSAAKKATEESTLLTTNNIGANSKLFNNYSIDMSLPSSVSVEGVGAQLTRSLVKGYLMLT